MSSGITSTIRLAISTLPENFDRSRIVTIIETIEQELYEGGVYASATADNGYDPLYRFYNTRTGTHFYTASETERAAVTKLVGFVAEGIAYYVDA